MVNAKRKISKIQIARRVVQILGLIFLPGAFILAFSGIKDIYLAILSGNFSFTQNLLKAVEVITVIPVTILFGRFFCGWLCAFGTFNDFIYLISNKVFKIKFKINEDLDWILKSLKYILLIFIGYFIWTKGSTLFETSSPWDAFAQMPNFSDAIAQYTIGSIFLVVIAIGAMFIERFFCRYLCPLGAIFAVTSKFRIFDILKKRDNCGKCRLCTNSCSVGIPMYKQDKIKSGECINCFKCLDACPRKNTKVEVCGEHVSPAVATCIAIGGFIALYSGTSLVSKNIPSTSINQNVQNKLDVQNKLGSNLQTSNQNKKYKDGTYTGTGNGYRPGLQVSVTIKNGKIADIQIGSNNETQRFGSEAFSVVPNEIVKFQSTEVDGVSGATRSSDGIKEAVENALNQALQADNSTASNSSENNNQSINNKNNVDNTSNNSESTKNSSSTNNQNQKYKDGVYNGTGRGYKPNLQVSVTIKNGKIADIQIGSNNETQRFGSEAFSVVPNEIVQAQSTEVDGVSGATRSSNGIKQAVEAALSKAKM